MHVSNRWYLDCCPEVYTKIKWSLQAELERVVAKNIAIILEEQEKKKTAEDDYKENLFI